MADGLYAKYTITNNKTGEVIENAFVLRPDKDIHARIALTAYARSVQYHNHDLARDLFAWAAKIIEAENTVHGTDGSAGADGEDVRTVTAAEAAADKALWEAVGRSEVEVTAMGRLTLIKSHGRHRNMFEFTARGAANDTFPTAFLHSVMFTVRRVQPAPPAGDEHPRDTEAIKALRRHVETNTFRTEVETHYLRELLQAFDNLVADDEENATLRAQLAEANARVEKAEQQNVMYKHIADNASDMHYLERENSRLLYRTLAASAPDALLAVRDKLNQAGTERDKVSSEMQRRIQKAVMALLNDDSAEALAALRADSEHDSAEAAK